MVREKVDNEKAIPTVIIDDTKLRIAITILFLASFLGFVLMVYSLFMLFFT